MPGQKSHQRRSFHFHLEFYPMKMLSILDKVILRFLRDIIFEFILPLKTGLTCRKGNLLQRLFNKTRLVGGQFFLLFSHFEIYGYISETFSVNTHDNKQKINFVVQNKCFVETSHVSTNGKESTAPVCPLDYVFIGLLICNTMITSVSIVFKRRFNLYIPSSACILLLIFPH